MGMFMCIASFLWGHTNYYYHRGPKPKYPIRFLDNQIAELRQLISSQKAPQGQVMRAKIILAAHEHAGTNTEPQRRAL